MIFDARSSLRRWTSVTLSAKRVRNVASSTAESPPPTTAISWPRKKNPSHVAHVDTPWPSSSRSESSPSMRACAPVEMMIVWAAYSVAADPDPLRVRGEVDAVDVGGHELGAEAHRLLAELRHELGAEDPVGKPG